MSQKTAKEYAEHLITTLEGVVDGLNKKAQTSESKGQVVYHLAIEAELFTLRQVIAYIKTDVSKMDSDNG